MNKQLKRILFLIPALLILVGAFLLLNTPETEQAAAVPEDTALFSFTAAELTGAEVKNSAGGYTLTVTDSTGSIAAPEGLALEESKLKSAVSACRKIKYASKITDGAKRLTDFGLDTPAAEAVIHAANGGEVSFSIGNTVPGEDTESRYVLFENEVYVVYKTYLSTFLWNETEFASKTLTPDTTDSENRVSPVSASVSAGENTFTVALSDKSTIAGYSVSAYRITAPVDFAADPSAVTVWLDSLFNLEADETAAFVRTGGEPAEYGLDMPKSSVTLTYTLTDGTEESLTLLLSERQADGSCYAMLSGGKAVYRLNAPAEALFNTDCTQYLSRDLPYMAVSALSKVKLTFAEGETYEAVLTREESGSYTVSVNGRAVETDSFRNFFYILISAQLDTVDISGQSEMTNPVILTVEYTGTDGSVLKTVLCRQTDRVCEVFGEGIRRGELTVRTVNEIEAAIEQLAAGEEVKARY